MFTLDQIREAHQSTVKTGADFPKYIQKIIQLGVASYATFVSDGHTVYYGKEGTQPETAGKYPVMEIAEKTDAEKFKLLLKLHQQGKRDFATFCRDCAATGVEKWVVSTAEMTCIYYGLSGEAMLTEKIPAV